MKTGRMTAVFFTALIASASASALAEPTQQQLDQLSATLKASMGGGMMHGGMMNNESVASTPDAGQQRANPPKMQGGTAGNDPAICATMGAGTMGNHMMHSGMMHGAMAGNGMMRGRSIMPQLPPGNEKLQLKMQAEIMQKVGEILAKYADQVVVGKGDAQ
ncbi:MAG TPA: hypothetical protein VIR04_09265 [Paralcaligenes sp.]|jgi:hypothetical protein